MALFVSSECLLVYAMQAVYTEGCSTKLYLIFRESSELHIWMTFWPSAKGTGNAMDIDCGSTLEGGHQDPGLQDEVIQDRDGIFGSQS